MEAKEVIKALDPLLARLAEIEETREKIDREMLSVLRAIASRLGVPEIVIPPPAPTPIYLTVLPPEIREEIELHPEWAPTIQIINRPGEPIIVIPPKYTDYITEEGRETVVKDSPVEVKVKEELGRDGQYGYITSDEGTIKVRINAGDPITLEAGQTLLIHELNLLVTVLKIETDSTSALAYRMLVV